MRRTAIACLLALACGLSAARKDGLPEYTATSGDLAVYSAYLTQAYAPRPGVGTSRRRFVLRNENVEDRGPNRRSWERYLASRAKGDSAPAPATVAAFADRPRSVIQIYSFPAQDQEVVLLRDDMLGELLSRGWPAFYNQYPGAAGVISFGGIGYSPDRREALFIVRVECGSHCGYRNLVFMRKEGQSKWELMLRDYLP